jgi:hypothetical protein
MQATTIRSGAENTRTLMVGLTWRPLHLAGWWRRLPEGVGARDLFFADVSSLFRSGYGWRCTRANIASVHVPANATSLAGHFL